MTEPAESPEEAEVVRPRARFFAALVTWVLIFLSSPGLGRPEGYGHTAFVALMPWALYCSRPGPRAKRVEWLAGSLGFALSFYWLGYVLPFVSVPIGFLLGLYFVVAGAALRLAARRFPLTLAVPVGWMVGELLRWTVPEPLAVGWFRLGTFAHDSEWMAGSARVWGTWGLSFVFAAFGGWLAELRRATLRPDSDLRTFGPHSPRLVHWSGLGPVVLAVALSLATSAPETEDGPTVLIVQPGFEQERKQQTPDPFVKTYGDACGLMLSSLSARRETGAPDPDFVAWGETMLFAEMVEPDLLEAWDAGARPLPWTNFAGLSREHLEEYARYEGEFVRGGIFGIRDQLVGTRWLFERAARDSNAPWAQRALAGDSLLPPGTAFFSGAILWGAHDGALRRKNAVFFWDSSGRRSPAGGKVELAPGAEEIYGLQSIPGVTRFVGEVGGYIPSLLALEESAVLPLETRDGRSFRVATQVCFDNAFDGPFTAPLRREPVDFHLVASNEAWYETSVEMDWMVAFSRMRAIATGRSVVRAANSGVSIVIDPEGFDVAVLEVEGRRKMVRGTLLAAIPVPVRVSTEGAAGTGGNPPRTLYVRTEELQIGLWWVLLLVLLLFARSRWLLPRKAG